MDVFFFFGDIILGRSVSSVSSEFRGAFSRKWPCMRFAGAPAKIQPDFGMFPSSAIMAPVYGSPFFVGFPSSKQTIEAFQTTSCLYNNTWSKHHIFHFWKTQLETWGNSHVSIIIESFVKSQCFVALKHDEPPVTSWSNHGKIIIFVASIDFNHH